MGYFSNYGSFDPSLLALQNPNEVLEYFFGTVVPGLTYWEMSDDANNPGNPLLLDNGVYGGVLKRTAAATGHSSSPSAATRFLWGADTENNPTFGGSPPSDRIFGGVPAPTEREFDDGSTSQAYPFGAVDIEGSYLGDKSNIVGRNVTLISFVDASMSVGVGNTYPQRGEYLEFVDGGNTYRAQIVEYLHDLGAVILDGDWSTSTTGLAPTQTQLSGNTATGATGGWSATIQTYGSSDTRRPGRNLFRCEPTTKYIVEVTAGSDPATSDVLTGGTSGYDMEVVSFDAATGTLVVQDNGNTLPGRFFQGETLTNGGNTCEVLYVFPSWTVAASMAWQSYTLDFSTGAYESGNGFNGSKCLWAESEQGLLLLIPNDQDSEYLVYFAGHLGQSLKGEGWVEGVVAGFLDDGFSTGPAAITTNVFDIGAGDAAGVGITPVERTAFSLGAIRESSANQVSGVTTLPTLAFNPGNVNGAPAHGAYRGNNQGQGSAFLRKLRTPLVLYAGFSAATSTTSFPLLLMSPFFVTFGSSTAYKTILENTDRRYGIHVAGSVFVEWDDATTVL